MKGFIRKAAAGCCLLSLVGCYHYRELVDPCWPERYNAMARHSVREIGNAQANAGHVLDQTVYNWHFECDPKTGSPTDRLNPAGIAHLTYISRRKPVPDCHVFLQHAQDLPYLEGIPPEKLVHMRAELNERRMQAIERFLATQAAVHGGGAYQVAVLDVATPSIPGAWTDYSQQNVERNIKSGIPQNFIPPPVNK